MLEWYDFSIHGFFAAPIGAVFFESQERGHPGPGGVRYLRHGLHHPAARLDHHRFDRRQEGPRDRKINSASMLMITPVWLFFGWLADHIGRESLLLFGALIGVFGRCRSSC